MDLILLPGNSKSNKEWIEQVEDALKDIFRSTRIQYYSHWDLDKDAMIDFEKEIYTLSVISKKSSEYVIFAKSAGVLLALMAIKKSILRPIKCIFVGTPVHWAKSNSISVEDLFHNFNIPTLFIQKTHDPAFHCHELKGFIEKAKVRNPKLIELPGEDHHYEDVSELKRLVEEFVKDKDK